MKNTSLAEINKQAKNMTVYDDVLDGRFRDRLKLDNQTVSLTITNTTTQHAGRYELQTNSVSKSFKITVFDCKYIYISPVLYLNQYKDAINNPTPFCFC